MLHSPKRTLHLTTPLTSGEDVRCLQVAINARARVGRVDVDGQFGPVTQHAAVTTAIALGITSASLAGGVGVRAQTIIRAPDRRTPLERYRASARAKQAAKIAAAQATGPAGAIALALSVARRTPHVTENPAGSNSDRGGLIDQMQHEVGIAKTYWCGAAVHWWLQHGGGLDVTTDVRFVPWAESHAKNGTGGFARWIPVERAREAPVGSLITYDEHGVAAHIELLCCPITGPTLHSVGGNTSLAEGSQSNGGAIAERERPLGGAFPARGFLVPRW